MRRKDEAYKLLLSPTCNRSLYSALVIHLRAEPFRGLYHGPFELETSTEDRINTLIGQFDVVSESPALPLSSLAKLQAYSTSKNVQKEKLFKVWRSIP
jgi:hypothetical protein